MSAFGSIRALLGGFGRQKNVSAWDAAVGVQRREMSSQTRTSTAIQEFLESIRDQIGLTIVDFSGSCEQNVSFITGLRHRLYAESLPKAVETVFGPGGEDEDARLANPERIQAFLEYSLNFEPASIDAILLWDGLEWLSPEAQRSVVGRIHNVLRPGGMAFAVFHTEAAAPTVPVHYYRLFDSRSIVITDIGKDRTHRLFTNRNIERLFENFQQVKFYLSRDQLREVLIRR
jgi:SAM-dependent methyltransferase